MKLSRISRLPCGVLPDLVEQNFRACLVCPAVGFLSGSLPEDDVLGMETRLFGHSGLLRYPYYARRLWMKLNLKNKSSDGTRLSTDSVRLDALLAECMHAPTTCFLGCGRRSSSLTKKTTLCEFGKSCANQRLSATQDTRRV